MEILQTINQYNTKEQTKYRSRKSKYLLKAKEYNEHISIDNNIKLSTDLFCFSTIATDNIKQFIDGKTKNELKQIIPLYVTEQEEVEGNVIQNKTIADLRVQR